METDETTPSDGNRRRLMEYLLTVLANGRHDCLSRVLRAAAGFLDPAPRAAYIFDDGGRSRAEEAAQALPCPYEIEASPVGIGMCRAHARCWAAAADSYLPFVFHLEEDLLLLRPVPVELMGRLLRGRLDPPLAQVGLVRAPWGAEIPFGGYIAQEPGWYERKTSCGFEWIETTRNWSCAPALFETALARQYEWPAESGCETAIGPMILRDQPDAKFALWGGGEAWAAHIGVDRAPGAHGY